MKKQFSKEPLFYLGNPYTHKHKKVMSERYKLCDRAAARLMKYGIVTYPPIALNARWNAYEEFPNSWDFWEKSDKNFLERCDGLIVLMLDGWEKSIGLQSEIEYAKKLGLPIAYTTYEEIMDADKDIESIITLYHKVKFPSLWTRIKRFFIW